MSPTVILLLLGCILPSANSALFRLTNDTAKPLHYDVALSVDTQSRSFSVSETILITVIEDSSEIEINSEGLEVDWLANFVLISEEDGQEFRPTVWGQLQDEFRVVVHFDEPIVGGKNYFLSITDAKGQFGKGLIEYSNPISNQYFLSTDHYRTSLRSVFPCFDEPGFRTTFSFRIEYDHELELVTNSNKITFDEETINNENKIVAKYEIEVPVSTWSIGFMFTNITSVSTEDNRVSVYHPDEEVQLILLKYYKLAFVDVEKEFNFPIECPTFNIVYSPILPVETITKWCLIFVNPKMQPVENSEMFSSDLKDIQREIFRSVYHFYFGHVISPEWWNSQWIFLGLTRFLGHTSSELPFDANKEFVADTVHQVLKNHNVFVSDSMRHTYIRLSDINEPDLHVIEQRPSVLMRMIRNVIGPGTFKAAILDFFANHRYSSVTDMDFIEYLDNYTDDVQLPESMSVSELVVKYATAFPSAEQVSVSVDKEGEFLYTRFYTEYMYIPVDYQTPTKEPTGRPLMWLSQSNFDGFKFGINGEPWVVINPEQYGMYVVDYSNDLWKILANELIENHERFNRGQLITDASNQLSTSGGLKSYMNLIRYLPKERDVLNWKAARETFEEMLMLMRGYEGDIQPMYEYFNSLVKDLYLENRIQEDMPNYELTIELAKIACYSGNPDCIQDVKEYLERALENPSRRWGSGDFQMFVFCTLAKASNETEILESQFMNLWSKDRSMNSEGQNALRGLACSSEITTITSLLNLTKDPAITVDEYAFVLHTLLRGSHEAVVETVGFLENNLKDIHEFIGTTKTISLFNNFRYYVRTYELDSECEEVYNKYYGSLPSMITSKLNSERIFGTYRANIRIQPLFPFWVAEEFKPKPEGGGSARNVPFTFIILLIGLLVRFMH